MDEKLANSLGRIESKIDGLHDDIMGLKEADTKLHERISRKDESTKKEINDLKGADTKIGDRVSKLEAGWAAIKWILGGLVAIATAIGTFLAGRN